MDRGVHFSRITSFVLFLMNSVCQSTFRLKKESTMYVKMSRPNIWVRENGSLNICRLQIFHNLTAAVTRTMKLFKRLNIVQL